MYWRIQGSSISQRPVVDMGDGTIYENSYTETHTYDDASSKEVKIYTESEWNWLYLHHEG